MHYCGCDIQLQSVITVSDEGELPSELDERALAWEALYVPSEPDEKDPNKAPTEVAPSLPDEEQGSHLQFLRHLIVTLSKETFRQKI